MVELSPTIRLYTSTTVYRNVTQKTTGISVTSEGFILMSSQDVFLATVVSGFLIRDLCEAPL